MTIMFMFNDRNDDMQYKSKTEKLTVSIMKVSMNTPANQ